MRFLILASAFVAAPLVIAPIAAQAATPGLSEEFQAICANNLTDMNRSVAAAEARGYQRMPLDAPDGIDSVIVLSKTQGSNRWVVIVGHGGSPARGAKLGQAFTACSLSSSSVDAAGADEIGRWVAVPAASTTDKRVTYFFTSKAGRRTALDANNEPAVDAALRAGGYYLLQIDRNPTSTVATLTQSVAAP